MKRLLLMTASLLFSISWLSMPELSAQTSKIVRGQVLEESTKEPLPGVSILERGTTNGTVTDLDGNFVLKTTTEKPMLRLSFIGFKTQEIAIEGDEDLKISMASDLGSLEEVVVVGYGERQKETITGAISSVTSRDIEKVPGATVSGALAGKMAGLSFRQPDGRPGAGAWLQIRNMGTPLFVIDGIQKDEGQFNNLAPTDIESITILKDAAAAVYGSRAANGVVVVKTKQGKRGENPTINLNGYYGWQNWSRFPEGVDAYEWMLGKADADINQFGNTNITAEELEKWNTGTEYGYRSFDWYDFIIQGNAPQSNFNASVSGGSDKTNYYISATQFDQKSVFSDEFEFSRTNIQSNITTDITDKLTVGVQLNGRIEERNNPGVPGVDDYWQPRFALFRNRPTERPYANDNPDYPANINNIETNWALLNYDRTGFYENKWQVIQSNFNAEYEILPGLNAKGMYSYYLADNIFNTFEYTYDVYGYNQETDEYFRSGGNDNPYRDRGQTKIMENVWQVSLNYDKTFNDKHHVSALFLNERIQRTRLYNFVHSVPTNNYLDLIKFADMTAYNDERQEEARIGYVGRVNYDFAGKYLVEVAGRADASWKFSPDNRWGFFPSLSAGWRISEEAFMNGLSMRLNMDELKIRASYGQLGDDNIGIGPFDYMTGYRFGSSTVIVDGENIQGSANTGQPIDNLTWYTSNITDIGLDFSFASGKITGQADYFYRKRTGLRGVRNDIFLPLELGYGLTDENLNTDAHSGAELAVNWNGKAGEVVFRIGGNVSYARGKFLQSYNPTFSNSWDHYRNSREDRYNGVFWGYEVEGQFTSFEQINDYPVNIDGQGNKTLLPGDFIYKDVNNDGKIDGFDERPIGYQSGGQPIVNFGLNFNFAYKGFDLTADFSGGGMYSYNQNWEMRWPFQNGGNLLASMYDDRYHREDVLDINSPWVAGKNPPLRFNTGGHSNYNKNSTWWLTNVKYLRMRTLELGYTLPERLLNKWKMQTARVFVSSYNLFALDNVHQLGTDPEVAEENGLQYPQNKVVNVGFNISF